MAMTCPVQARRATGRLVVLCLLSAPALVLALWAPMTLEQLVKQSELIVIGELVSIRHADATVDIGTIRVDEVLRSGTVSKAASVSVSLPARGRLAASTAVFHNVGQRGIWFLRKDAAAKEPVYFADHPHRFQSVSEAAKVRAYLKTLGR